MPHIHGFYTENELVIAVKKHCILIDLARRARLAMAKAGHVPCMRVQGKGCKTPYTCNNALLRLPPPPAAAGEAVPE